MAIDRRSPIFQSLYTQSSYETRPSAFGDDFCRRHSIVLRGATMSWCGDVRRQTVLGLPCAGCPLGACTCGALRLFDRLWDSKLEQIEPPVDGTKW